MTLPPENTRHAIGFLLTRPLRDVTMSFAENVVLFLFLLTRPLRDVTPSKVQVFLVSSISTHTPLAGRDFLNRRFCFLFLVFLLTRPLRDVTFLQDD